MKIAAVAAVTQCFGAGKADFAQSPVRHVVYVAKQTTQIFATVFNASRMPQTPGNCNVVVVFAALLRVLASDNKKQAIRSELPALLLNLLVQRFHRREQQYVADGLIVCKQHNHTVNTYAQTACRGHAVF